MQQTTTRHNSKLERDKVDLCSEHIKGYVCRAGKISSPQNHRWIEHILSFLIQVKFMSMQKKKGVFQHSSFLAGGATSAAGRLVVENGSLKVIIREYFYFDTDKIFLPSCTNQSIMHCFYRLCGLTVVITGQPKKIFRTS